MLVALTSFLGQKRLPEWALALVLGWHAAALGVEIRELSSLPFPNHKATSDVGDILSDYPEYLEFVLAIGNSANPSVAKQIKTRFEKLRRQDHQLAARFLKGLRFEMVQKMEFAGLSTRRVNTSTPEMRQWVAKYLPVWLREVDEYQFRAFAASVAKR